MTKAEIKDLIQKELPQLLAQDPLVRDFVLRTVSEYYAPRTEFDQRFNRVLDELQRDREEQRQKWEENTQRLDRIEAQNSATLAEIQKANRRYESTIGALGSRWGLHSEASFRNGLKAILEESFGVQVLNLNDFDDEGMVFGRPDQVEIDLIIKNGTVIVCEIKSSISKPEIYSFDRKVAFYQKRHQRPVSRKMVISPMVDDRARPVAELLGIEVYSYADTVENL